MNTQPKVGDLVKAKQSISVFEREDNGYSIHSISNYCIEEGTPGLVIYTYSFGEKEQKHCVVLFGTKRIDVDGNLIEVIQNDR